MFDVGSTLTRDATPPSPLTPGLQGGGGQQSTLDCINTCQYSCFRHVDSPKWKIKPLFNPKTKLCSKFQNHIKIQRTCLIPVLKRLPFLSCQHYMASKDEGHKQLFDLIEKLMEYDPAKRLSLEQALQHPFFSCYHKNSSSSKSSSAKV